GLPDTATAEMPSCSPGQALETGRHGRQVFGVLAAESLRSADGQAVTGKDDGLVDLRHAGDQVVEEPVQVARRLRVHSLLLLRANHVTSRSEEHTSELQSLTNL